ncbi:MAG TPA: NAD(P)/FAD-dependent oxidoreductase, partial [Polyangiaceae bacterium]|nr:NAD(P)/FAD-dependent oxidoreductase [Polyangiaceae bacterium]
TLRAESSHFDVLIVGAGLSGVGAAYHLQARCPGATYALLEAREAIGGTWDLFRYPGIRSDSDMYTLGYSFKPWTNPRAIADGPSILEYVRETAREHGIEGKVRFRHRVERASWSSADARWTVEGRDAASGEPFRLTCGFLLVCSGYYDYEAGYEPAFPGRERFGGRVVHPQHWPEGLDYAGRRVAVVGSGATAVTLVPEMARRAAHVTMVQRSPTYVMARPSRDAVADWLRARLPAGAAYAATRWKNVLLGMAFYAYCRRLPAHAARLIVGGARRALGDLVDAATHLTPRYSPWDQRLCLAPDGDFFAAVREGRASIVTDHVEAFTERGLRLRSGAELEADLVVLATGLKLKILGGAELFVDGARVELSKTLTYKGSMFSDVPNLAFAVGYTNASWTLKCDLTSEYVCRLLNHLRERGLTRCCPRRTDPSVEGDPIIDFSSGYVQRALAELPRQGPAPPWKLYQNYVLDLWLMRHAPLDDGTMQFS